MSGCRTHEENPGRIFSDGSSRAAGDPSCSLCCNPNVPVFQHEPLIPFEKRRCSLNLALIPELIRNPSWIIEEGVNNQKYARLSIKIVDLNSGAPRKHPGAIGKEEGPNVGRKMGVDPTLLSAVEATPDWAMDCFAAFPDIAQTEPALVLFMTVRMMYLVLLSLYIP